MKRKKAQVEKAETFEPDQRNHEEGKETHYRPVVGHRRTQGEIRAQQPGFPFVDAELKQATDHVSE